MVQIAFAQMWEVDGVPPTTNLYCRYEVVGHASVMCMIKPHQPRYALEDVLVEVGVTGILRYDTEDGDKTV